MEKCTKLIYTDSYPLTLLVARPVNQVRPCDVHPRADGLCNADVERRPVDRDKRDLGRNGCRQRSAKLPVRAGDQHLHSNVSALLSRSEEHTSELQSLIRI